METEYQELEVLDEGCDVAEGATTCCTTGSPTKLK